MSQTRVNTTESQLSLYLWTRPEVAGSSITIALAIISASGAIFFAFTAGFHAIPFLALVAFTSFDVGSFAIILISHYCKRKTIVNLNDVAVKITQGSSQNGSSERSDQSSPEPQITPYVSESSTSSETDSFKSNDNQPIKKENSNNLAASQTSQKGSLSGSQTNLNIQEPIQGEDLGGLQEEIQEILNSSKSGNKTLNIFDPITEFPTPPIDSDISNTSCVFELKSSDIEKLEEELTTLKSLPEEAQKKEDWKQTVNLIESIISQHNSSLTSSINNPKALLLITIDDIIENTPPPPDSKPSLKETNSFKNLTFVVQPIPTVTLQEDQGLDNSNLLQEPAKTFWGLGGLMGFVKGKVTAMTAAIIENTTYNTEKQKRLYFQVIVLIIDALNASFEERPYYDSVQAKVKKLEQNLRTRLKDFSNTAYATDFDKKIAELKKEDANYDQYLFFSKLKHLLGFIFSLQNPSFEVDETHLQDFYKALYDLKETRYYKSKMNTSDPSVCLLKTIVRTLSSGLSLHSFADDCLFAIVDRNAKIDSFPETISSDFKEIANAQSQSSTSEKLRSKPTRSFVTPLWHNRYSVNGNTVKLQHIEIEGQDLVKVENEKLNTFHMYLDTCDAKKETVVVVNVKIDDKKTDSNSISEACKPFEKHTSFKKTNLKIDRYESSTDDKCPLNKQEIENIHKQVAEIYFNGKAPSNGDDYRLYKMIVAIHLQEAIALKQGACSTILLCDQSDEYVKIMHALSFYINMIRTGRQDDPDFQRSLRVLIHTPAVMMGQSLTEPSKQLLLRGLSMLSNDAISKKIQNDLGTPSFKDQTCKFKKSVIPTSSSQTTEKVPNEANGRKEYLELLEKDQLKEHRLFLPDFLHSFFETNTTNLSEQFIKDFSRQVYLFNGKNIPLVLKDNYTSFPFDWSDENFSKFLKEFNFTSQQIEEIIKLYNNRANNFNDMLLQLISDNKKNIISYILEKSPELIGQKTLIEAKFEAAQKEIINFFNANPFYTPKIQSLSFKDELIKVFSFSPDHAQAISQMEQDCLGNEFDKKLLNYLKQNELVEKILTERVLPQIKQATESTLINDFSFSMQQAQEVLKIHSDQELLQYLSQQKLDEKLLVNIAISEIVKTARAFRLLSLYNLLLEHGKTKKEIFNILYVSNQGPISNSCYVFMDRYNNIDLDMMTTQRQPTSPNDPNTAINIISQDKETKIEFFQLFQIADMETETKYVCRTKTIINKFGDGLITWTTPKALTKNSMDSVKLYSDTD